MKKRKDTLSFKLNFMKIFIVVAMILVIVSLILSKTQKQTSISSELSRYLAYEQLDDNDAKVYDTNDVLIPEITFNAFTLKDTDDDGYAEKYDGSCQQVGTRTNLYLEVALSEGGRLNDDVTITFNGTNCNFTGTIVKDLEIDDVTYASSTSNVLRSIKLKDGLTNFQKLIFASITSNIGNNINNYSNDQNKVTISGSLVDAYGETKTFSKTVNLTVDWYGEVAASFYMPSRTATLTDLSTLLTPAGFKVNFGATLQETKNQILLETMNISGTIPELGGCMPSSVKITGTNVEYIYNEETGEFVANRRAVVADSGNITSQAYSTTYYSARQCPFSFELIYPIEAYETLAGKTEDGTTKELISFEIKVPVEGYVTGYNTSLEGFNNPETSNIAKTIVTATFKKYIAPTGVIYSDDLDIYVGNYAGYPYYRYEISKEKPLSIYNGIVDSTVNDNYNVTWRAYTYTNGTCNFQGYVLQEKIQDDETLADRFRTNSATDVSMEDILSVTAVGFGNASSALGTNGWIKIYDNDTNKLIKELKGTAVDTYTSSNRLALGDDVKSLRIETSPQMTGSQYFYVYQTKTIDDEYLTSEVSQDEFDDYVRIYSTVNMQIKGNEGLGQASNLPNINLLSTNYAYYEAAKSKATLEVNKSYISAHETAENQVLTIRTVDDSYNMAKWQDGEFIVKFPTGLIDVQVLNCTVSNSNVKIMGYDLYTEEIDGLETYFLKIITRNTTDEGQLYSIDVTMDMTPDSTKPKNTQQFKLYAYSKNGFNYTSPTADIYDVNGNLNTTETVQYATVNFTVDPGNSLSTTEKGSNYDEYNGVTLAPRVAMVEKEQRTADITISATNNYSTPITNVSFLGVIPFEGNTYLLSSRDLESTFTTSMTSAGITLDTSNGGIDATGRYEIYYSSNENPTNDLSDDTNGWMTADEIEDSEKFDWSDVRTFLIVLDSDATDEDQRVSLATAQKIEFKYTISIPEGLDYNMASYSQHAVYFDVVATEGLLSARTASQKLGFMISKQFTLNITKVQTDTPKVLGGVTFSLTEDGQERSIIKTTNASGQISFTRIYAERKYTLKELIGKDDYELITDDIVFETYSVINEDSSETLYLRYLDGSGKPDIEGTSTPTGYEMGITIENDAKLRLKVIKKNTENTLLKNVSFKLTDGNEFEKTYRTNSSGEINVSGLSLDTQYTLEELDIVDHYLPSQPIKFTVYNDSGTFRVKDIQTNETFETSNIEVTVDDYIPIATINVTDEIIPTYSLQITKYAKGETDALTGEDVKLEKAQFRIYGPGLPTKGKLYTTDENGVLTIPHLYEYVNDGYKTQIDGVYTVAETYAPEGYTLDSTPLKFRAQRIDGNLTLEAIDDEGNVDQTKTEIIRDILKDGATEGSENPDDYEKDISYTNRDNENAVIQIGVENEQIFRLFKYYTEEGEQVPIPGVVFTITDLDGNTIYGSDGNPIGEEIVLEEERVEEYQVIEMVNDTTYPWIQDSDGYYMSQTQGKHSSTTTLKTTDIVITQDTKLTFDYKVSSESNYDKLTIKVNSTTLVNAISGTVSSSAEYTLTPGKYTITATYTKDGSTNSGSDAGYIGNIRLDGRLIEAGGTYVIPAVTAYGVTTDDNGLIKANLPQGFYKLQELKTGEEFVLDDQERIFGVSQSQEEVVFNGEFSINGYGSVYIESIAATLDNGVVNVGSFEEYPDFKKQNGIIGAKVYEQDGVTEALNGIDVDGDQKIDHVSMGSHDGMITRYDSNGTVLWSKTFGGDDDDQLSKVIVSNDGGYICCGHVSSGDVYYDGTKIDSISWDKVTVSTSDGVVSKTFSKPQLKGKDGVILKLDSNGNLEFAIRVGGEGAEWMNSVAEDSAGNIYVAGEFKSEKFYCYDTVNTINTVANEDLDTTVTYLYQDPSNSTDSTYDLRGVVLKYSSEGVLLAAQKETKQGSSSNQNVVKYNDIEVNDNGVYLAMTNTTDSTSSANSTYSYVYKLDKATLDWVKSITVVNAQEAQNIAVAKDQNGNIVVGTNYGTTSDYGQYNSHVSVIDCANNDAVSKKYTLSSAADDVTMYSLDTNASGKIIFTGCYYNATTGNGGISLPVPVVDFGCNGYVVELGTDYMPIQWNYCYGNANDMSTDNDMTPYDGINVATCCALTNSGIPYFAGWFEGSEINTSVPLTTQDPTPEPSNPEKSKLVTTKTRDTDGFMIACGEGQAEIPEQRYFAVENAKKEVKVQTQVNSSGGDINGQTALTTVDTVTYGENSTVSIVVSPHTASNYILNTLKINGLPVTNYVIEDDGTIVVGTFENMTEDILVEADFSNTKSMAIENHYLWTGDPETSLTKLAETNTIVGDVGSIYSTEALNNAAYSLISNDDYYGATLPSGAEATDSYIPKNASGYLASGSVETINYYYTKNPYTLTVMHMLEGTSDLMNDKNGNEIEASQSYVTLGDEYTTSPYEDIDYNFYELVETPDNAQGTVTQSETVIYYYRPRLLSLDLQKVAQENRELTLEGTTFTIYEYTGAEEDYEDDLALDATSWTALRAVTSDATGNLQLVNLSIDKKYKLVETVPTEGRNIPNGHWNIAFTTAAHEETTVDPEELENTQIIGLDNSKVQTENSYINLTDGELVTYAQITPVGTPTMIDVNEGQAQISNIKSADLPTTGSMKSKSKYILGALFIIAVGMGFGINRVNKSKKNKQK